MSIGSILSGVGNALWDATQTVGDTITGGLTKQVRDKQVENKLKAEDFVPAAQAPKKVAPPPVTGAMKAAGATAKLSASDFAPKPPVYATTIKMNGEPEKPLFQPIIPKYGSNMTIGPLAKKDISPDLKGKLSPAEQWERDKPTGSVVADVWKQLAYGISDLGKDAVDPEAPAPTNTVESAELATQRAKADFWEKATIAPLQILGVIPHAGGDDELHIIKSSLDSGDLAGAQDMMDQYKKMKNDEGKTSTVYGTETNLMKSDKNLPPGKVEKIFRGITGTIPELAAYTLPYTVAGAPMAAEELGAAATKAVLPEATGIAGKTGQFLLKEGIKNAPQSALFSIQRSEKASDIPRNAAIDFATLFPLLVGAKGVQLAAGKGVSAMVDLMGLAAEKKVTITPKAFKDFLNGESDQGVSQIWNELPNDTRAFFLESQIGEARMTMLKEKTPSITMGENRPAGLRGPSERSPSIPESAPNPGEPALPPKDTAPPSDTGQSPEGKVVDAQAAKVAEQLALVNRVIDALDSAKSLRGVQENLYSQERSARLGRAMMAGKATPGEAGYAAQLSELKGELPKVEFETLRDKFKQTDIDSLFSMIEESPAVAGFQKINAKSGLAKLFGERGGVVPTEGELTLLSKVFPKELVDGLLNKRPFMAKAKDALAQIINLPRSVMASFDLSYGLRQGVFAAPRNAGAFFDSFKKQFQWFASEDAFKATQEAIAQHKWFPLADEAGISFTEMDSMIGQREEKFMSQWAERIPLVGRVVRASGRSYTAFANKFRMDIFGRMIDDMTQIGLKPEENMKTVKQIADFVNAATGRGSLGKLEGASKYLNGVFFSPRLMASRVNLLFRPDKYLMAAPIVRQEYLKTFLAFGGTATTILGLAKLGGADVETDPRSSDFGKIKIGNTRFDIMGGFQQYIRMAAQLTTGQYISSTTGKQFTLGEGYKPLTRWDILMRQIESKEAPVLSFITAIMKQQDYSGQPVSLTHEIISRFYPMMVNDLYDVYKDNPALLPAAALGSFGIGVQTYQPQQKASTRSSNRPSRVPVRTRTNTRVNPYRH